MEKSLIKKSTVVEVTAIRILIVVFQLLFLKIYTHYSNFYELGIFYLFLTASYSFNAFLLVPLDYFQQSQLYNLKKIGFSLRSFYSINRSVMQLMLALMILGISVCYFINRVYCVAVAVMILFAMSTYLVNLLRGMINNLEYRRSAIYCMLLEYVLKIVCFLVYIQFFKASALTILLSLLTASVIAAIVLFILLTSLNEYKTGDIKTFERKEIIKFAYPISISAAINWIQTQSYSLILVPLGLTEVVGIYATVANVGQGGMNAYSTIFSQLFTPNIYKTNGTYIKTYVRNALLSVVLILIISALFSKIIIGILTKDTFVKYAIVLLYGIICEAGNFIAGALTVYLTLKNYTKVTLKMSTIGLFTFIITFATIYLCHFVSVFTVGIPIAITQIVIATGLYIATSKQLKSTNYQDGE